uniref:Uncharacterized protein n=1 Tax=Sphaerodactylus townsendi TaxID=933632 RepID=A0ACB8FKF1_9SAUR
MEDQAAQEEGEAEIQELHGPEHWFSKWERQCLAEAERDDDGGGIGGVGALPPELQDDDQAAAAAASPPQPEHKQQKLWHLFQNSATAVAQLYKDRVCQQPGLSLWVPFQNAATAVTNLYKASLSTGSQKVRRDGIAID